MSGHTKGSAVARFHLVRIAGHTRTLAIAQGVDDEEADANAARLAAGWNLLEALEEMDAVGASASLLQQSNARASATEMRRLRDAISLALSPSPAVPQTEENRG